MKRDELIQFIQRIIATSAGSHSAALALGQLKEILSEELAPEDRAMMDAAIEGVLASFPEMKAPQAVSTPDAVRASAQRAKERKRREEEAARYGRC